MEDSYFTLFIAELKEAISEKNDKCEIRYLSKEEEKSADLIEPRNAKSHSVGRTQSRLNPKNIFYGI